MATWGVGLYPEVGRFKSRLACRSLPKRAGPRLSHPPASPSPASLTCTRQRRRLQEGTLGGRGRVRPPDAMTMLHRGMEARFQGSCCWAVEMPIGSATLGLAQLRGPQCPRCVGPRCLSHAQMKPPPSQSSVSSRPLSMGWSPTCPLPAANSPPATARRLLGYLPRYMPTWADPSQISCAALLMNPLPPSSSANLASSCHSPSHSHSHSPSLRPSSFLPFPHPQPSSPSPSTPSTPSRCILRLAPTIILQQVGQLIALLCRERSLRVSKRCFGSVGSQLSAWSLSSL